MANSKISALTSATTPLAGTETLPVVQSSTTKKVAVSDLTAGRTVTVGQLLTGTGDASAGANLRKYTAVWNTSPNTYPYPAGNIFGCIGDAVAGQENWFGFTGNYGTSSGSVNLLLQQNLNNFGQQAGNFVGSEATGATTADIILGKLAAGGSAGSNSTKTIQARLTSGGDLQIASGNLVPSTAAKGINFTANSAAAGMTSQLLNWYEEGTWTPVAKGTTTAGTGTYSVQIGRYTRIGRRVFFTLHLTWSAHTGTGNLYFDGLPYASNSTANLYFTHSVWASNLTFTGQIAPIQANNSTSIFLDQVASNAAAATVPMDTSAEITISGSYEV